jgi:hypothetical protein
MMLIAAAAFTLASMVTHTDTTLTVRPGTVLDVSNYGGSVAISSWNRNAVHVEADHSRRTNVQIETGPNALQISTNGRYGPAGVVDFQIEVPVWMSVTVRGPFTDVQVEGTKGGVTVETVRGEVAVTGGSGIISLSTVQGSVSLQKANGRMKVSSINEGVSVEDVVGDIDAQTVNGSVSITRAVADAIEAVSVSGDLMFAGNLKRDGQYHFQTHSGDIQLLVPDKTGAYVGVSTFTGEFGTNCPVQLTQLKRHKQFQFTLGGGGAQLELESFSGDIQLQAGKGALMNLEDLKDFEDLKDLKVFKNAKEFKNLSEIEKMRALRKHESDAKRRQKAEEAEEAPPVPPAPDEEN